MSEIKRVDDHEMDHYAKYLLDIGFKKTASKKSSKNVAGEYADDMPTMSDNGIRLSSIKDKFKRLEDEE